MFDIESARVMEKWMDYRDANVEFRVKLKRVRTLDSSKARQAYIRLDRTGETVDDPKFLKWLADTVIVDWEGLQQGGQPWPCTPENKLELMDLLPGFFRFVSRNAVDEGEYLAGANGALASSTTGSQSAMSSGPTPGAAPAATSP